MTLSPRFALLLAAPALFATACSLDTDKFEFSNADISAAGAAGSAGSSSVGVGGTGGSDVGGAGGTGGSDVGGSGGVDAGGTGGTDIGGSGGTDVGGAAGTTAAGAGGAGAAGEGGAGGATGGSAGSSGTGGGGSGGGLACTESLTGAQRCSSDGAIEECDGTDWVANPVTCANGCVAKGVLAFCKACEPNSVRCTDTLLEVCKADGSGYDVTNAKTCGGALPVCNEAVGDCTQCKQGDAICINGFATTCTAEGVFPLSGGTDCGGASRCVDGACLTAVCASGETKCDASGKVSTCKADLTDFTTPVACPVGSTCVEGRGCLECDFPDGTQFCDGDVATTCTNGKKSINATCGSGQCVVGNNIALCNSCTDGTVICAGNSLQKCVGSTFQEVTACKSGTSCNATLQSCTECTGSDVRCSATGDLQTCGADGKYAVTKACGKPELCDVASQSCFECVPGTTQCTTSGVLQSCSEKGSWLTTKDCGQASLCDAGGNGCIAPECATGETRCDGRQPQVCSKDRRGWEAVGAQCAEACIDFKDDTAHGCVNIESVTAGSNATCAIVGKDDQRLACWGAVAGEPASSQPQFVPDARLVSQVAIGGNFVCAMYGGSVRCWGKNGKGQLGPNLSPGTDSSKPVKVGLPGGQTPAALVAMDQTACALSSSGSTYCWGGGLGGAPDTNKPTLVTDKLSFVELTASGGTVCGKDGMATGYCWGNGVRGKLGNNTGVSDAQAPDKPVSTLTLKQIPAPLVPLGSLSSGGAHACAIGTPATGGSPGQAYCWGGNAFGQLGRGSTDNQPHLTAAAVSSSLTFSQLATGDNHTCAITSTGAMVCWGRGTQGQNGQTGGANAPAPTPVTIPESILGGSLTAGSNHSCVATKGKVYCWGDNGSGQLGAGAGKLTSSAAPVAVVFP